MGELPMLYYLPIFCVSWMALTLVITYTTAVYFEHVYAVLPYISDTGALLPESCIFGFMLNFGSFIMGVVIFVRFKYIELIITNQASFYKIINKLNALSFIIGMLSILGALIVASFQVTNATLMHLVGANVCFGCSLVYFVFQTFLCYVINEKNTFWNVLRTVLSILYAGAYGTSLIYAKMALAERNALYPTDRNYSRTKSYPYYKDVLNYAGLEFPIKLKNIAKF